MVTVLERPEVQGTVLERPDSFISNNETAESWEDFVARHEKAGSGKPRFADPKKEAVWKEQKRGELRKLYDKQQAVAQGKGGLISKEVEQRWRKWHDSWATGKRLDLEKDAAADPLGGGMAGFGRLASWAVGPDASKLASELTPAPHVSRYAFGSEQEAYLKASPEEQSRQAVRDSVNGLFYAIGPTFKLGGKGLNKLAKYYKDSKKLQMVPVEDAVTKISGQTGWRGFDYGRAAAKTLKKVGFAEDEATTIAAVRQGADPIALKALAYEKGLAGEKLSKGWKTHMGSSAKPYGAPQLSTEVKEALDFSTAQSKHFATLYRWNAKRAGFNPIHADALLKKQTEKFYGEEIAKSINLKSLSEKEASNLIANMISPEGQKFLARQRTLGAGRFWAAKTKPERFVWGAGEDLFKTKSKIFDRVVMAKSNVQRYSIDRMRVFSKMLEQRGYGKVTQDEFTGFKFVPDKEMYNQKTTQQAKNYLEQIDDIMQRARRDGGKEAYAEAKKASEAMLKTAQMDSPKVAGLVKATWDFNDTLYREALDQMVPKVAARYPLTPKGQALVQRMGAYWGPKAELAFSTKANWEHKRKALLAKKMVGDYQKLMQGEGILALSGKAKERALKDLSQSLSYGKGSGFPEYLEYYLPRMAKRGQNLEANWTQALTGKAGFMETRKLGEAQERVDDFAELIESRVRSQGKALYFYDEVSQAVNYAKKLPGAWQQHTEFLISRATSRPSKWDEEVAQVLTNLPMTKSWDAYRVQKAAQNLNSMTYGGLLGVRPGAILRNYAQIMTNTMPDLGMANVMKGAEGALNPKTRKYLRDIGIISEFIPDQQVASIMPKFGKMAKYNDMKDSFMWAYNMSDRHLRYATGATAKDMWERSISKVATKADGTVDVGGFSKAIKLNKRNPWVKNEIESLLHLGKGEEAKAVFIRDAVADTQYLYTALDAPAATGSGGVQKTLTSFQSWWMNYAGLLNKWAKTGEATDKVSRGISFMIGAAGAEQYLEASQSKQLAESTVGVGPFPLQTQYMPPVLEPGVKLAQAVYHLGKTPFAGWERYKEFDAAGEAAVDAMLASGKILIPGGLAIQQATKGYSKDKWQGVMDALTGYKRDEKFEPLWKKVN